VEPFLNMLLNVSPVLQAANLNNCLKNVIYEHSETKASAAATAVAEAAGPEVNIPAQELVVVFDADMVCKPVFFRHVSADR
jgi:hypothetical protein